MIAGYLKKDMENIPFFFNYNYKKFNILANTFLGPVQTSNFTCAESNQCK